jgi:hypothetical protein
MPLRGSSLFLPAECQEIVHRSVIEDLEKHDSKRWQCESGNRHANDNNCFCNSELIEGEEFMIRIQQRPVQQLPLPEHNATSLPRRPRRMQLKTF